MTFDGRYPAEDGRADRENLGDEWRVVLGTFRGEEPGLCGWSRERGEVWLAGKRGESRPERWRPRLHQTLLGDGKDFGFYSE